MSLKPRKIPVVHPGALLQELLDQYDLTQSELARHLKTSHAYINDICKGRRSISTQFALKLGKAFSQNPRFWLDMQIAWDLENAKKIDVSRLRLSA